MNQFHKILPHLVKNTHLTPIEAQTVYGIFNLKGRIADMRGSVAQFRRKPIPVKTTMMEDAEGKRYARYSLDKKDKVWVEAHYSYLFKDAA